jgi:tetratricopeptide (TPR) repeat protein
MMVRCGRVFLMALALLASLSVHGCRTILSPSESALSRAESFKREGRLDDAIEAFRDHMKNRLRIEDRPDWENPYLYLLTIGDLYLQKGEEETALAHYSEALEHGVESSLVADRYRNVARLYEASGRLEDAVSVLKDHRDLDPLLFDGMLDRISKRIVAEEERGVMPSLPTPNPVEDETT